MILVRRVAIALAVFAGVFGGSAARAADWVAASSYADAENKWTGETAAYDTSTSSYASDGSNRVGWGAAFKLNYATPVNSDRVRVSTDFGYGVVDRIKLTVTYNDNSSVTTEYDGTVVQDVTLSTLTFTKGLVKSVEFSYRYVISGWNFWLYDLKLYQCPETPAPLSGTTLDPTSVNATSAVMHGKMVSNGGSPCYGRFVFWKLVDAKFYSPWRGDLGNNQEFTAALSGLEQNASYSYQVQLAPTAEPAAEQIVTAEPVKTFTTVKVDESSSEEWVSPSHAWADAGTWENADQAMDDDTATGARFYHQINGEGWSPYLHFETDLQANGIRLWAPAANVDQVDIDILKDGVWQDLYQGVFTGDTWQQFPFEKGLVIEARIRLHASISYAGFYWNVMEVDFHQKSELRTTRYFVGAGAWNNAANWSATSGGAGGASVPGTGCVAIFDANSPNCTLSAPVSVEVLRLDAGFSGVLDAGANAITIERNRGFGELLVAGGELKLGSATHTVKDAFRFTGGVITPGTSTVGFLAPNDGSAEVAGNLVLNNVRFYHSNSGSNHKVLAINGAVTASGSLAIEGYDAGGWNLYLNGGEIVAKGAITGNGKVVRGTSSLTISGDAGDQTQIGLFWGTSGTYTVNKPAGKVIFGANEKFGDPTMSGNAQTKLVLTTEVDAASAQQTVWLCGYGYGGVKITGDLTVYNANFYRVSGTGTSVYDLSGSRLTVLNSLDLNIPGDGGWHVNVTPGTVISCKGNVTATNVTSANWAGATFVVSGAGNQSIGLGGLPVSTVLVEKTGGTVSFPDGITSTAISFSPGSSVVFGAGKTVQTTSIYWRGAEGQPIVLRSSVAGQQWLLDIPALFAINGLYVEWVDVQDSQASLGGFAVVDVAGTDSGNNVNWDFLQPIDLQITTPAESTTSPAWVEGAVGPNVTQIEAAVNGGVPFAAVREAKMKWFATHTVAPKAMGVELSPDDETDVTVTARTASGREASTTQHILWTATDLRGKDSAIDSITIRKGDSLLLTAAGSEGELALTIDADGDGTYEFSGIPGDKVASSFNTAGVVTVSAKIDGNPVGSLKIMVVSVDIHGPIACELYVQREKPALVVPVEATAAVSFVSNDADLLAVSIKGQTATGAMLYLHALNRGEEALEARIGGASGPIVARTPVDEFTMDIMAKKHVVTFEMDDGSSVGTSRIVMRPYVPNLRLAFSMFASTSTFAGGARSFSINTLDVVSSIGEPGFQQEFDLATGETNGVFEFDIEGPLDATSICFSVRAYQASSEEFAVDQGHNNNGTRCTLSVNPITMPVGGWADLKIEVKTPGRTGVLHEVGILDSAPDNPAYPLIEEATPSIHCGSKTSATFTVFARNAAPGRYNIVVDGASPKKKVIAVLGMELAFGRLKSNDQLTDASWYDETPWGDVKLVDLAGGLDDSVDIVMQVHGLTEEDRTREVWKHMTVYAMRLPCDLTEAGRWDGIEPEDDKRVKITLDMVETTTHTQGGATYYAKSGVKLRGAGGAIPGDVTFGDDGVKEVACVDFLPVGLQTPPGADAGSIEKDPELECDALVDALLPLGYVCRGVAHPETGNSVHDYDGLDVRKYDDKGGRYWGRPIANKEFIAAAGVEKLVITVYKRGEDAKRLWKTPGKSGDGVDHILFRNPADIFYYTGVRVYAPRNGGAEDGVGMADDFANPTIVICPGEREESVVQAKEGEWTGRVVVLTRVWKDMSDLEYVATNGNGQLSKPLYDSYESLAKTARLHGVLGFYVPGDSRGSWSRRWVATTEKELGASVWMGWIWAMQKTAGEDVPGDPRPGMIRRKKKDGSQGWDDERFSTLGDDDSGADADGWESSSF